MVRFCVEERICDAQILLTTEFQHALSIVIHLAHPKMAHTCCSGIMIRSHPSIEVTKNIFGFRSWDTRDDGFELIIEHVLCLCG